MSNIQIGPYHANRHSYIIPDVIDASVTQAQARKRLKDDNESTVLHYHKHDQSCIDAEGHRHELVGDCQVDEIAPEVNKPTV